MRRITLLVIHCSAVRPDQTSSAAQIDTWHRQRGWKLGIGYHYVIRRNGEIEEGRPEWLTGAHCQHHNAHSIGICYEGGLDIRGRPADTRTARADCRSSRPEPAEGVPVHPQCRSRICRPAAAVNINDKPENCRDIHPNASAAFYCDIIIISLLRYCIVCNGLTRYDESRLSWWWQQC